ncbi:MAG: transposase [Albidovulum sp.]|nr:transposase [Albidovulum sp.]
MPPGRQGSPGRTAADSRLLLEAVLWRVRTGLPRRDLRSEFGNWNSVFVRFRRWTGKGVFEGVFKPLSGSFELERAQVDGMSTVLKKLGKSERSDFPRFRNLAGIAPCFEVISIQIRF